MSLAQLEELLNNLDTSNEYLERDSVCNSIRVFIEENEKDGDEDSLRLARLNYEFLRFYKKIDEGGISFEFAGTDEQGNPYEWPSIEHYGTFEFSYLKERFDETSNSYLKSEYGLLLILSNHEDSKQYKSNEIATSTCESLIDLSRIYVQKFNNDERFFDIYLINAIRNCIGLAQKRKLKLQIDSITHLIIDLLLNSTGINMVVRGLPAVINSYYSEFSKRHDLTKVLEHLWQMLQDDDKSRFLLIMGVSEKCLDLSLKMNVDSNKWLKYMAKSYERYANECEKDGRPDVTFYLENALMFYKRLKDDEKVKDLAERFEEAKKQLDVSTISTDLPEIYVEKIKERNQRLLNEGDSTQIIHFLTLTGFLPFLLKL